MNVGIIGGGAWGKALSAVAVRAGNKVVLWSYDETEGATNDMAELCGADVWLIATPAAYFRETMQKGREFYNGQPIIICTKGMDEDGKFMSRIAAEELSFPEGGDFVNRPQGDRADLFKGGTIGVLSGPQFAAEVAAGKPTGSAIAGGSNVLAVAQTALSGMVLEETDDVMGVQICGAGKNTIAILMGYLDGKGAGENERALRLTQAWGEIVALGRHLGARTETFLGLAGLGDLFLSATSKTSRNYAAGLELAKGGKPVGTIEGVSAICGLSKLSKKTGILMPNMEFLAGLIPG